jgi:hypothetical protein
MSTAETLLNEHGGEINREELANKPRGTTAKYPSQGL